MSCHLYCVFCSHWAWPVSFAADFRRCEGCYIGTVTCSSWEGSSEQTPLLLNPSLFSSKCLPKPIAGDGMVPPLLALWWGGRNNRVHEWKHCALEQLEDEPFPIGVTIAYLVIYKHLPRSQKFIQVTRIHREGSVRIPGDCLHPLVSAGRCGHLIEWCHLYLFLFVLSLGSLLLGDTLPCLGLELQVSRGFPS